MYAQGGGGTKFTPGFVFIVTFKQNYNSSPKSLGFCLILFVQK